LTALVVVAVTATVYVCCDCEKKPPLPQPVSPSVAAPAISAKNAVSRVRGILASLARMRLFRNSGSRNIAALIGSNGDRIGEEGGVWAAVSPAVLIAKLKEAAPLFNVTVAGVKTAVAPAGSPEAVSVIG